MIDTNFWTGYVVTAAEDRNGIPKLLGIPQNHRIYAALAWGARQPASLAG
jgi:hypothetical protein